MTDGRTELLKRYRALHALHADAIKTYRNLCIWAVYGTMTAQKLNRNRIGKTTGAKVFLFVWGLMALSAQIGYIAP